MSLWAVGSGDSCHGERAEQCFAEICADYFGTCEGMSKSPPPIFFGFGLTSTEDLVLESHCDAATLSCLTVKRFRMRPPFVFLDAVFTEVAVLKHYLALPHPQLLAPLEEAEKFLSSISDAKLLRLVSTYPSLLSFPVNMEVDQSTHFVVTRQLLQDSLLRHWLVQLILPSVIKWVLALFGDLHKHPMTDNASSFR
ncbi:origin recognition complex subunit [Echinococcus granulosus]|uniref:Origin recognition complex subunit n=1 Tax=Echinococcus granulosus TaxID=6210 RepID=W6U111_ECHGR|nr:origin recognition complex subunit [Echinococcus granulosus]EUB54156.1 origin recognition complex subunit [Echinococcus granulosus]